MDKFAPQLENVQQCRQKRLIISESKGPKFDMLRAIVDCHIIQAAYSQNNNPNHITILQRIRKRSPSLDLLSSSRSKKPAIQNEGSVMTTAT